MTLISNERLLIGFSDEDGSVLKLADKKRGIVYVDCAEGQHSPPFEIDLGSGLVRKGGKFRFHTDAAEDGTVVCSLEWKLPEARVRVEARISLAKDAEEAVFTSRVVNEGQGRVLALKYPVIGGLGPISAGGQDDYLVHPYATGFCVHDPFHNFAAEGTGFASMPYPESFSGCSMQFLAYYGKTRGGLYAAAYDPDCHMKWLNFCRRGSGLELSLMYGFDDAAPGKGTAAGYPFVVRLLPAGGWHRAADLYKRWAVRQKWCAKGTLASRAEGDKAKWLLEDVGLATFGIDASRDRSRWLKRYHELTRTRIFHITGPDWPKAGQNYGGRICGGYDDWFPVRFDPGNLRTIRENGDYYAPFEFDAIVDPRGADGEELRANRMQLPERTYSLDGYRFHILCPATGYAKKLHVERDRELMAETGCDALYYDISANNLLPVCMDAAHEHRPGAGGAITRAFKENYEATRAAVTERAGKYVPIGTEMMNEVFLDDLDFYQARAWAEPASAFEGGAFRALLKSGEMRAVPLFSYVYHEYGAQRLDGWGKLVGEIGDLFYHTVAKTYLWGGIYELNYEYSPMEAVEGVENDPAEHYCPFKKEGFALREDRAAYLAQFAGLRTGCGNQYLAYGRMLPPLELDTPAHEFTWMHYNCSADWAEYHDSGVYTADSVVTSSWMSVGSENPSVGIFFANTTGRAQTFGAALDIRRYGVESARRGRLIGGFSGGRGIRRREIGTFSPGIPRTAEITLDPYTVVMLELVP